MSEIGIRTSLNEQLRDAVHRAREMDTDNSEAVSEVQDILDRKSAQMRERFLRKLNRIRPAA